jgi:hypothetical protein
MLQIFVVLFWIIDRVGQKYNVYKLKVKAAKCLIFCIKVKYAFKISKSAAFRKVENLNFWSIIYHSQFDFRISRQVSKNEIN